MTEDESNEKRKNDEFRLLYTSCVSEISSFKQQQWQITNYGLLLYVAIASIPKLVAKLTQLEYFLLYLGAFAILTAGWLLLGMFSASIQERRGRLAETRKHFTDEFMAAWRCGKTKSEAPDVPEEKPSLLWFFRVVFVVGFSQGTPVPPNGVFRRTAGAYTGRLQWLLES